jgi:hypothetical protein
MHVICVQQFPPFYKSTLQNNNLEETYKKRIRTFIKEPL